MHCIILAANKQKVYYGLLKEPDLNVQLEDDEEEEADKPKVTCRLSKAFHTEEMDWVWHKLKLNPLHPCVWVFMKY